MLLSACTIGDPEGRVTGGEQRGSATKESAVASEEKPQPTMHKDSSEAPEPEEGRAVDLEALVEPGTAVAVAGAGEAGETNVPAWSTMKVPVAIAALRKDPANEQLVTMAIQQSDNAAAEQLWASLGSPEQAGQAVNTLLSEVGDSTQVNTAVTRPGFSSFGQTQWSMRAQAEFASQLQCIRGAERIVDSMGNIGAGGDYGLGTIPGAIFKGGWGPDTSGAYGVRQFGLIPKVDGGYAAVAIAAQASDGSYASAQEVLTRMAKGLQERVEQLPNASC